MNTDIVIAITTCHSLDSAKTLSTTLVSEGLAACINQFSGVLSTYVWEGELHRDGEIMLLMKTTQNRLAALETRLKELHPYEVPEFIVVPVCAGSAPYLDWIRQNTASKDGV